MNLDTTSQPKCEALIVVVHYGAVDVTQQTLTGLMSSETRHRSIVVVSNDGSPDPKIPGVIWLGPPQNLGYFGAVRFAIDHERARHLGPWRAVVVLNNDLLPEFDGVTLAHSVDVLIAAIDATAPSSDDTLPIGVAGPHLFDVTPAGTHPLPGLKFPRFVRHPRQKRSRSRTASPSAYPGASTELHESVDWIAGAAFSVAADLIDQVLDPSYFLGGEDLDLSFRVWKADRRVVRVDVNVGHRTSSSIGSRTWSYLGPRGFNMFFRRHAQRTALVFGMSRDFGVAMRHLMMGIGRTSRHREQRGLARLRIRGSVDGALLRAIRTPPGGK